MAHIKNKIGMRFGRLVVVARGEDHIHNCEKIICWVCKCDCGNYITVMTNNLRGEKHTRSCGCLSDESRRSKSNKYVKHGLFNTKIYHAWNAMKQRCFCETNRNYKDYGGRGITVCDDWRDDFNAFYEWAMENGYADDLTLDRIDVNGNYEPDNCRWVTQKKQANNRRSNLYLEYNGETHTAAEWGDKLGAKRNSIVSDRIRNGWSIERAVTTPVKERS